MGSAPSARASSPRPPGGPRHRAARAPRRPAWAALLVVSVLALALAVVAATLLPARETSPSPTTTAVAADTSVPAVGAVWRGTSRTWEPGERERALDALAGAGVGWVRLDVSWAEVQPARGPLDTDEVERVREAVALASARGMEVLVTFWLTPAWAGPLQRGAPDDVADYASALADLARAVPDVAAWQVWTEPNTDAAWASADAGRYADLLVAARPALRAAAPDDRLVMAGTAYNDAAWIDAALEAGAAGRYDVMATHPWSGISDRPATGPDDGTPYTFAHLGAVLTTMERHGDGDVPVWLTEAGWSTHADAQDAPAWQRGVTEDEQARYSAEVVELCERDLPRVRAVFFPAVDRDTATEAHEDNDGLLRDDLSAKPVLGALAAALEG